MVTYLHLTRPQASATAEVAQLLVWNRVMQEWAPEAQEEEEEEDKAA